ncbi:hypothetical protein QR680_002383 [Steinernema hermaphroditum]|uniref:Uncharacterized protein n=1 Tax=Steinernema hermaphroditum TaxID=289476 RepID=A0AA39H579_9BILA|nr:hypothetical protein QR680_002383 [Steinernema hermaphroditum]
MLVVFSWRGRESTRGRELMGGTLIHICRVFVVVPSGGGRFPDSVLFLCPDDPNIPQRARTSASLLRTCPG